MIEWLQLNRGHGGRSLLDYTAEEERKHAEKDTKVVIWEDENIITVVAE